MRDPRLRLLATVALSIAAYCSLAGAAAAGVWWLLFSGRTRSIPHPRALLSFIALLAVFSAAIHIGGGDGISYLVRFSVIALIAAWTFADRQPGELLDLSTWCLGERIGFEIGLVAEMSMRSLEVIAEDFERIRQAQGIKGVPWGVRSLVPAVSALIHAGLVRAEDQADLLAVRGYRRGGTSCPRFSREPMDVAAAASAILVGLALFVPAGDIFILLQRSF
ncbi:MAG: energy-coupling factor transporter transmembrane component T [Methanomicrobiales archaeon]|nr:energy-coupling factor transporter transmembrane component T [Methanomicrobiales archaeon]MDI6876555.1 energy-coupling factor transporter transmembrane component T [Methanomicrobiales archaeon]